MAASDSQMQPVPATDPPKFHFSGVASQFSEEQQEKLFSNYGAILDVLNEATVANVFADAFQILKDTHGMRPNYFPHNGMH